MLDILRAALPRFCDQFVQELKEPTAHDGPFVVRASPKNKEEEGEWVEEFARIAGVSYIASKTIQLESGAKKDYRAEFLCHHADKNMTVKSSSASLIENKHKATGCSQRLYVSIQRSTENVRKF
jgi:hypothetical protein